jgi:hypothetical protein
VLVDLFVKGFAQHDGILTAVGPHWLSLTPVKPEMHAIEEVEPGPIKDRLAIGFVIGSEEDGSRKDPLEPFHHAAVPFAVLEEMEEVKHLGGGSKADNPAALAQGQGSNPNCDEPVLAVRKPKLWVADNLEEEFAVAADVRGGVSRRASQGEAAQDERASMKSELLSAGLTLFANELNGFELL